jgi:hypothetical protein
MFKKTLLAIAATVIACATAFAGVGTSAMDILKVPVGLRSQAMGGAYTAISDDLEAIDVNPAGLTFIEGNDLLFIQDIFLQGIIYDSLYYAHGAGDAGTYGGSFKFLSGGSIQQTNETSAGTYAGEGPSVSASDFLGAFAYGVNFGKISYNDFTKNLNAGADLKVSGESIGKDYSNFAVSFDLGAIYTLVIEESDFMSNRGEFVWNKAGFGLAFKNLGTSFGAGLTPISMDGGAYIQMLNLWVTNNRVRVSMDTEYNIDNGINLKTGLEYMQLLGDYTAALRLGGNLNPADRMASGLSFGGGIGMKINGMVSSIDYVFMPYGELGASQKIGLYLKF